MQDNLRFHRSRYQEAANAFSFGCSHIPFHRKTLGLWACKIKIAAFIPITAESVGRSLPLLKVCLDMPFFHVIVSPKYSAFKLKFLEVQGKVEINVGGVISVSRAALYSSNRPTSTSELSWLFICTDTY